MGQGYMQINKERKNIMGKSKYGSKQDEKKKDIM